MSIIERSQAEYEAAGQAVYDTMQALFIVGIQTFFREPFPDFYKFSRKVQAEVEHYENIVYLTGKEGDKNPIMLEIIRTLPFRVSEPKKGERMYLMKDDPEIWMHTKSMKLDATQGCVYFVRDKQVEAVVVKEERREAAAWVIQILSKFPVSHLGRENDLQNFMHDSKAKRQEHMLKFFESIAEAQGLKT